MALFPTQTTTGSPALFLDKSTYGLVQGSVMPDPAVRFRLRGGVMAASETLPLWGGCAIYANVPGGAGNPSVQLGQVVGRAASVAGTKPIAGFAVNEQAYNGVTNPASQAPQWTAGESINFYPLRSLARITVGCDPTLLGSQGGVQPALTWDFVNQLLIPFTGAETVASGTYNTATGAATVTLSAAPGFAAGDEFTLSGLTGTGAYASLNGTYLATSVVGNVVSFTAPAALGAATITGGSLTTGATQIPATNIQLLDVQASNCMTIAYNAATGFTNYAYTGACAVIQLT
jgi:hypothetical protein